MKIKIVQDKLAKALNNVSRVAAGSRATLPILSNVLIRVDDNKVTLTTTNLDMAVVNYLPASGCENGVVTVPAKLIAEFVSNLPRGEMVEIVAEGERVTIRAGEYSSVINGASAEDFPELPEIDETKAVKFKMGAEEFKTGLAGVMVATSNDMTRPALTGVYFNSFEGALFLAATDGYRLAERKLLAKFDAEVAAVVPAASLRGVLGLLDDGAGEMEVLIEEAQVRFRIGEVELTSKLLDGSFPNYRQLIPKESKVWVELDRGEMVRVTKLAALFAREVGGSITCAIDVEKQVLKIASVANELGENCSEIKVEAEGEAKATLNSRYVLDALNVFSGKKLRMGFGEKLDPMLLKDDEDKGYIHLIMPLRG